MQISFVMLIFLLFSDQISGGAKVSVGATASGGVPPVEENQLSFQTDTEERSEVEFFYAVWKRNGVISCSITEQSTAFYVLTVLEHGHMQSDVITCTVIW